MIVIPIFAVIIVAVLIIVVNFFYLLFTGEIKANSTFFNIIGLWTVVVVPVLFIVLVDFPEINDCCSDSAVFSPEHRIGIYALMAICTLAYIASIFRKRLFPPVVELLINVLLILGLIINIILCFHLNKNALNIGFLLWLFGNIPVILLLLMELYENQILLKTYIDENDIAANGLLGQLCLSILKLSPLEKYPILFLLTLPVLVLISAFLFVFGQQADSLIRAFTDTYKHGFSQLDYMCDNVQCGGHFLCSVGANGHRNIVKPIRYGERNGQKVICNRQLLISNAFEDLLQEKWPVIHRVLRANYNKVGQFIHRYYGVFNIKLVSDFIYIIMKPLEWFFLLSLYVFDRKPENRIAMQYLSRVDRDLIAI